MTYLRKTTYGEECPESEYSFKTWPLGSPLGAQTLMLSICICWLDSDDITEALVRLYTSLCILKITNKNKSSRDIMEAFLLIKPVCEYFK